MKRILFAGRVVGGRLTLNNRREFEEQLRAFDGPVMGELKKATRSVMQNALLWVYNTIIARDLGWTPEEVHEFTKSKINMKHKTRLDKRTGELIDEAFPGSTHNMSSDEFTELLEDYVVYWTGEGYTLQSPQEYLSCLESKDNYHV